MKNLIFLCLLSLSSVFVFNVKAQCNFNISYEIFDTCDGCVELFVFVNGGQAPYTYEIQDLTFSNGNIFFCELFQPDTLQVTDSTGVTCEIVIDYFPSFIDVVIEGPPCLAPNQTGVLTGTAFNDNGSNEFSYNWNTGETTQSISVIGPGTYCLTAIDLINGCETTNCISVPAGGIDPIIEVVSGPVCMDMNNSSDCQKVCSNTTLVYEVTNSSPGTELEWEIEGAESVDINQNQATVTWGEAGFGTVTATFDGGGSSTPQPLNVQCGQSAEIDATGEGAGYIFISGGEGPYIISIGGITINSTNGGTEIINGLPVGGYDVEVTDAAGNTTECFLTIVEQGCYLSAYTEIIPPTNPGASDGFINTTVVTNESFYETIWTGPGGFLTNEEDPYGIVCGNYSLQIIAGQNCFDSLSVSVPCTSLSCGGETTLCVEILSNPIADFTTDPPASGGTLDICKGQPIEFTNQSIGATTYIWNFGDFTNSVLENPVKTYLQPGQYEVQLIAQNECFCADTTTLIVNVNNLEIPPIECTGTVCKGQTVTYETQAGCGNYSWVISGDATIIEGGTPSDNYITVQWNEGPEGMVDLTVDGCSPALCDAINSVSIPIITDDVSVITGPDKVCPNEQATYAITDFGGSDFSWMVDGGTIVEGQGTNQIVVEWTGSPNQNPQSVSVTYDNCFLGCGGSDELAVNIIPEFYIDGPIEVCANETAQYGAIAAVLNTGVSVNWIVLNNTGATIQSGGPSSMFTFNGTVTPGTYTVRAIPASTGTTCTPLFEVQLEVLPLPPVPTDIDGITEICPGGNYTYQAVGLPAHQFKWTINNGGVISEDEGKDLNITWAANGPYELSLTQTNISGLPCESEPLMITIDVLPAITANGTTQVCQEEIGIYTADFFGDLDYNWSVIPANAGTVIEGQGTNQVEIFWHSSGNHTIEIDACGQNVNLTTEVFSLPEPQVNHPAQLCPFEEGIVSTTQSYDSYQWLNENGAVVSTDPSPELIPGYYEVVVTDNNGCSGNAIFEIQGLPEPNISISTPGLLGLCGGNSITLFAIETTGGYSYQWFQDGNPVGTDMSTLDINQTGNYYTVVTDANGCTAQSNTLTFLDCDDLGGTCVNGICVVGVPPIPGCTPITFPDFTFNTTGECNLIEFQNTSTDYVMGSEQWDFRDYDSNDNFSTLMNPSHLFTKPGFFRVRLTMEGLDATGAPCGIIFTEKVVMVPAAADFQTSQGCVGSPVQFEDYSAFLPEEITDIVSWEWDFGDPASGAANTSTLQNPTHIYPDEATYNVTLTITTTEGCTSTVQKPVSVNQTPEVSFDPPVINCQATSLEFNYQNLNGTNIVDVEWNFDDPGSGDANTSIKEIAYHAFDVPGTYDVTITATNIYGCTGSFTTAVVVEPNDLTGNITPAGTSSICEGTDLTYTAPPGGSSWEWSNGETTESITVMDEGSYAVTVTNDDGCTYAPAPSILEIIPAPVGSIRAVEYNEFEQPTAFFDDTYIICEGEEVYLFAETSANYLFEWSTSETSQEISFTEDKGNLLSAGTYNYEVTITNPSTGCTAVAESFEVIVNETPSDVVISSNSPGVICDGNGAILTVDNPDPTLTYVWNTGELGTSITIFAAGDYFVRAINANGCEGQSNIIEIGNAPNINAVPSGCYVSCLPDTICLPNIPNVVSYQWFKDGVAIPAPEGTVADLIITETGTYTVELTDATGCVAVSDDINMELFPGFGNIIGEVYFDVNQNGIIDGPDTLMNGQEVILIDNGVFLDTAVTNIDGFFGFGNIVSSNNYTLLFNTSLLPLGWNAYQVSQSAALSGCDDESVVNFLIYDNCVSPPSAITVQTCPGTTFDYNGTALSIGDSQDFILLNQFSCDSVVTVTVEAADTSTETLNFSACQGSSIEYEGVNLAAGTSQSFVFVNAAGCDSTINVVVDEVLPTEATVSFTVCESESVDFEGQTYFAGTSETFVYQNQFGCDSTVNLEVDSYDLVSFVLQTDEICAGESTGYIEINDVQSGGNAVEYSIDNLNFQSDPIFEDLTTGFYDVVVRDQNGCTYTETIEVPEMPTPTIMVEDAIINCEEEGVVLKPIVVGDDPQNLQWSWSNGDDQANTFIQEAGVYTYTVETVCGQKTGAVTVDFAIDDRPQLVFMPNVFSPNGDAANDEFFVQLEGQVNILDFEMQIFDRWGARVFTTGDYTTTWDGTYNNGRNAAIGVYVVFIQVTLEACGKTMQFKQEGNVTLVR